MKIIDEGVGVTLSLARTYPHKPQQRAIEGFTDDGEYWGVYTICVPGISLKTKQTILDTNNTPKILELLKAKGLVVDTGIFVGSAFSEYPVVELTAKALELIPDDTSHA